MKIYTQTGDQGKTSLLSGERVSKNHLRIQVGGEVDELNSAIGAIAAFGPTVDTHTPDLQRIQRDLFDLCARLSAAPDAPSSDRLSPFGADRYRLLETGIDAMSAELPPLKGFILPGGHPAAAWAHVARCICRRAERSLVALAESVENPSALAPAMAYLNRLSDFLFMLARHLNHAAGTPDLQWLG